MTEYIEREALLRDIEEAVCFTLKTGQGANKIVDRIKCAPAADVVPVVHGRWEETDLIEVDDHGGIYRVPNAGLRCPHCMCAFAKALLWREHYCPNCGAKMDEEVAE